METKKYKQGTFIPKNKEKYIGKINPTYRSSWELRAFIWADNSPSILSWSSENVPIPYLNPIKKKICIYFPDLYLKIQDKTSKINQYVIEIKPSKETRKPIDGPKKKSSTLLYEKYTYIINVSKWLEAEKYCKTKGWVFKILTEKELGIITS